MSHHDWTVEFRSPVISQAIRVAFDTEIIIGRNDAHSDTHVHVDLNPYNAIKKGVSRRHARVFVKDNRLMLSDLQTANGTVLNGQKLQGDQAYPLTGEDSLILGAFRLSVRITDQPEIPADANTDAGDTDDLDNEPAAHHIKTDRITKPTRETVLIVEDHTEVAQLFAMILQKRGYSTQISRDATRAMRYLQGNRPDAVILDLMLPGMDGTEVCRYIRREAALDKSAIIVVSANRNPGTERAVFDAGADAFISKPVNAEELAKTVETFIAKRKSGEDITRELTDTDVTKALSEQEVLEIGPGVSDDTIAVVVAGHTDRPFTVKLSRPMTFGRGSYASPTTHVDLSRFNAKEKGVSRMHVRLLREDGAFQLQDMDSMNGTYVDGKRLNPNQTVTLSSGQEVRLGQLAMTIYFVDGDGKVIQPASKEADTGKQNGVSQPVSSSEAADE